MKAAIFTRAAALLVGGILLSGCNAPHSEEVEGRAESSETAPLPPVHTVALQASNEAVKLEGIATVLNPDILLQLDADIRAATIAANFSRGQLERFKASTMLSKQTIETAVRQAGIDASQLKLLSTRLRQSWGDQAPFLNVDDRQALMAEVANGSRGILRIDFPDTTANGPRNLRVVPLRGGEETKVDTFWPAPSGNLAMPGVSYFGLIDAGPGLRTGDRARVIADSTAKPTGVVIPSAAMVVYAGKSWCYVETAPGKYERKVVPLTAPVDDGYLVTSGFSPGSRVVVKGASILLAREAMPGSYDDDDDDDGGSPASPPSPVTKSSTSPMAQNHATATGDPD
ncbi:MAG: hypothetical protein JSR99_11260 [Proteobacteria bacterium]|nr:hypothetical protein [Pseudomonadota bacterium]